jgi:transposase
MRRTKLRIRGPRAIVILVGGGEAADRCRELTPGASVSKVAQRYGLNANLLFTWRRREARSVGLGGAEPLQLLPVTVSTVGTPAAPAAASEPAGRMEIVLIGGERIVVGADVDASSLARVVKARSRRARGCGWRRATPTCARGSTALR